MSVRQPKYKKVRAKSYFKYYVAVTATINVIIGVAILLKGFDLI